jgi:hemolysin III
MRPTVLTVAPSDSALRPAKPSWRGASHRVAFLAAPIPVLVLLAVAAGRGAAVVASCVVYSITFVALFGVSSSYHLCKGPPAAVLRWKRADHATIFLMIAGTYTPLCVIGVGGPVGLQMLVLIWTGAILGVLRATLWHKAPRGISSALYIALGWLLAWYMSEARAALGDPMLALMLTGGAFYTIGAVIYALKRPDPLPAVFGYHEIFHALVIAAAACHFVFVFALVSGA